jgi:hypothetical protein
MTLGELLYDLRTNMLRDSSNQVAGAQSDYLWTDETLVRYINEAEDEVARRTMCLRDATTPEVCQFSTVSNQEFYQLDDRVLSVMSVRMAGDNADLAIAGHSDLDTYKMPNTYFFDPSQLSQLSPGKPQAYTTDEGILTGGNGTMTATQLRMYPIPLAPYAPNLASMRVIRLPLLPLHLTDLKRSPEVPRNWHRRMLWWAASLALEGPDLDVAGGDGLNRAKYYSNKFDNAINEMKSDMEHKIQRPPQWSFGRNGFSYSDY